MKDIFKTSMNEQKNPLFQENPSIDFSRNRPTKIDTKRSMPLHQIKTSNTRNLKKYLLDFRSSKLHYPGIKGPLYVKKTSSRGSFLLVLLLSGPRLRTNLSL